MPMLLYWWIRQAGYGEQARDQKKGLIETGLGLAPSKNR
jgi:hypothetical protein